MIFYTIKTFENKSKTQNTSNNLRSLAAFSGSRGLQKALKAEMKSQEPCVPLSLEHRCREDHRPRRPWHYVQATQAYLQRFTQLLTVISVSTALTAWRLCSASTDAKGREKRRGHLP